MHARRPKMKRRSAPSAINQHREGWGVEGDPTAGQRTPRQAAAAGAHMPAQLLGGQLLGGHVCTKRRMLRPASSANVNRSRSSRITSVEGKKVPGGKAGTKQRPQLLLPSVRVGRGVGIVCRGGRSAHMMCQALASEPSRRLFVYVHAAKLGAAVFNYAARSVGRKVCAAGVRIGSGQPLTA